MILNLKTIVIFDNRARRIRLFSLKNILHPPPSLSNNEQIFTFHNRTILFLISSREGESLREVVTKYK